MEKDNAEIFSRVMLNINDELERITKILEKEEKWTDFLNELDQIDYEFYDWASRVMQKIKEEVTN